jgi:hypothetical protein
MPGAQKLRREANLRLRRSDEAEAKSCRWSFCDAINIDGIVKSLKMRYSVIPVKTGIQSFQ